MHQANGITSAEVLTIPVVFHVIHNGDPLGEAGNIPDEQVFSQLNSMNQDFRRRNADAVNTPTDFQDIAADVEIEFVLAKRDPEGLPTTGIVRKQGSRSSYSISSSDDLAAESHWPSEDYLNIWVTNLSSLLGFAQFPFSNVVGTNEKETISRLTDGVVLDWAYTGTGFNALDFSTGRTATHEIGHYLGLRHIHGDVGCGKDDFCEDTPLKEGRTFGCPPAGSEESCGSVDMFQNYMNLSDDDCMNLFTNCQSSRMRTVLLSSPRRKSLLTSKGGTAPVLVANDMGIKQVISPQSGACENSFTPQIEVRNHGTNIVESFTVELYIDDDLVETLPLEISLVKLGTAVVSFSNVNVTTGITHAFRFKVTQVNGVSDQNSENDSRTTIANFPEDEGIPHLEDFEDEPSLWTISNGEGASPSWSIGNAPREIFDNNGAVLSYYNAPGEKFGESDYLLSPVFDLSSLPSVDLSFKYAFASQSENITDALTVAVSTDCGTTFPESNYIFQRLSPSLGTTTSTDEQFLPEGPDAWEQIDINITEFTGFSEVVIAFLGTNGGGNNLYLDDISLTSSNLLAYDIGIKEIESLPVTTCFNAIFPTVEIKNFGFETIGNFTLAYTLDGNTVSQNIEDITILPGKSRSVLLQLTDLASGTYDIDFVISNPNGLTDEQTTNDTLSAIFKLDNTEDVIPLREPFRSSIENNDWTFIRPDAPHNWDIVNVLGNGDFNSALQFNGFAVPEIGIENWLISPVLDLTSTGEASMTFKLSYGNIANRNDRLSIYLSTDCGQSFPNLLYDKKGEALATGSTAEEWFPSTQEDWRTDFVDLSSYAIWRDARLAFVVTNQNGNNLFIDDIEFFNSSNPVQLDIENESIRLYPNPANSTVNIKLDLNNRTNLTLQLSDLTGAVVFKDALPNALNQTFTIDNLNLREGIYVLNLIGDGTNISKRLWIRN